MFKQRVSLSSSWEWRMADSNGNVTAESVQSIRDWNPALFTPSVIQMELLEQKIIENPDLNDNERKVQWVGHADWLYACSFPTPKDVRTANQTRLVFEGLDTFATVRLNGKEILECSNMFMSNSVDVGTLLHQDDTPNRIEILFESVYKKGAELESAHGVRTALERSPMRMHIRKTACHWGWDFGPQIMTVGPFRPIYLEIFSARIKSVHIKTVLSADHKSAAVSFDVSAEGIESSDQLLVQLNDPAGGSLATKQVPVSGDLTSIQVEITNPELWWPHGNGAQPLYSTKVWLQRDGKTLDESTSRVGIRTISLVQRPLKSAPGTTFMLNVNGKNIFCQGGNWIPADTMLPRVTREQYFDWMKLAVSAHHNMIRVWGGGIYETDDFFDACDELGLLVWHDLAFACGDYTINEEFLKSVEAEVRSELVRIRNRTSLVLLCGGNEDFFFQDVFWPTPYDHDDLTGPFEDTSFPQRKIYLQLLPSIVEELSPNIQYWPNSPFGGKTTANDLTVGDIHQWEVWHLNLYPYQDYPKLGGRFVSEFGIYSFPTRRTIEYFAPNPEDRWPQSPIMDIHSKGTGHESRISRYMAENFRFNTSNMRTYLYLSHLLQSEALGWALRHWKRRFTPDNEECAGALIWQLNDVFPGMSWSYVDYFLRPKPAFYTVRQAYAPISVGTLRTPWSRFQAEKDPERHSLIPKFEIFAHNSTNNDRECRLVLKSYDLNTLKPTELPKGAAEKTVTLLQGQNNEIGILSDAGWTEDSLIVLEASLFEVQGEKKTLLSRIVDWPEPFRYLRPAVDTKVSVAISRGNASGNGHSNGSLKDEHQTTWEATVTLTSNYPVKGVWMEPVYDGTEEVDSREPTWEDNMVDLMPDSPLTLGVNGLGARDARIQFLYDWEI